MHYRVRAVITFILCVFKNPLQSSLTLGVRKVKKKQENFTANRRSGTAVCGLGHGNYKFILGLLLQFSAPVGYTPEALTKCAKSPSPVCSSP
jgi:hypothetical protein